MSNPVSKNPNIALGDVVNLNWDDGYGDATVVQVHKDGTVDLIRPYIHLADFSMSGRHEGSSSVMHYFGYEDVRNVNPVRLKLVRKGPTLK